MLCRVHKKPGGEGAQPRERIQTGQRDIPYHVMSCPVCELGGGGRGRQTAIAAQGRAAGGEWLYRLCFCFFPFSFLLYYPYCYYYNNYYYHYYLILIIKLFLSQPTIFFLLLLLF